MANHARELQEGVPTDRHICQAILERDALAETAYYRRYRGIAFNAAMRWVPRRQDAEDLGQEALLRILTRLRERGLRRPDQLERFVHRTVRYVALEHLRRHAISRTIHLGHVPEHLIASEPDSLFDGAVQGDLDRQLGDLLKGLSRERDRQLLRNHYLDEASKAEICAQLGMGPDQFDRSIHRARKRLRRIVEANAPELIPHH